MRKTYQTPEVKKVFFHSESAILAVSGEPGQSGSGAVDVGFGGEGEGGDVGEAKQHHRFWDDEN